jgi:TonB family protein
VLPSIAQTDSSFQTGAAPSDEASWQRYLHIIRTSTLERSASEPFQLKVEYQLYDLNGRPAVKGTAEESWTEAEGKQVRIQSPSLVIGDAPPADRYAVFTRESYLVHQALNALTSPFPSPTERKDFAMDEFHQTLAGSDLSCFSLVQPGKTRTPDSPAYCTDADNQIVAMMGHLFALERGDFRKYLSRVVPIDLKLSYEGKPALTMHVTELDPLPDSPVLGSKTKLAPAPARVSAEAVAGLQLTKKDPKYPGIAKAAHIQGPVLIAGIITKQGSIAGIDVIASPDKILSKAAMDAVQTWTYRPYLLNGVPTELETTITVNFAMGK